METHFKQNSRIHNAYYAFKEAKIIDFYAKGFKPWKFVDPLVNQ